MAAASVLLCFAVSSCVDRHKPEPRPADTEIYAINFFAFNAMNTYYLWIDEVQGAMNAWDVMRTRWRPCTTCATRTGTART